MRRALALACIALPGLGFLHAQETQVFLRNGDRVTGTVVAEDASQLTLTNAVFGRFSLPVVQIERRTPMPPAVAVTNNVPAAASQPINALNPALARKLDELQAVYNANRISTEEYHRQRSRLLTEADSGVTRAAPIPPKPTVKISGEAQAGMDLGFATKDRQFYTGRFKLAHTQSRLRNAADYSFTYGYIDGEVSANRMDGSLKSDYNLTRRFYLYNSGGAGYDEIRKLDNYYQFGPGAGDHLIKRTNFVLNIEGGANFQEQNRADGTENETYYYRLAQDAKWTLGPRLSLDQKIEFFPQWDNVTEYRLRFEANIKYWLNSHLFVNLSMIDFYDTMPAEGVEPNDLQIRSTIGVRF